MENDRAQIQKALIDRYDLFWRTAKIPEEQQASLSPPLFLHVFREWIDSRFRVLVVGKETAGWGLDPNYHGRAGSSCAVCPFKPFTSFADWRKSANPVKALIHAYEIFDFSRNQHKNFHGPLWQSFRKLMAQVEGDTSNRRFMWSNLYRMDWLGFSVLSAPPAVREAVSSAQRSLLRDEIAILKPRAVVFLTGPNYDPELKTEIGDPEFHQVEDVQTCKLARLVHELLPPKSFRTYHPKYLRLARQEQLLKRIGNLILGP